MRRIVLCLILVGALQGTALAANAPSTQSAQPDLVRVRSADLVLKVQDYHAARRKAIALTSALGGNLRDGRTEVNLVGQKHGEVTVQVDEARLDELVDQLKGIGKLYSEHIQTNDRTSESETLQARISLLKQNEGELLGFLRSPRRMRGSDILFVQYRLYQSRVEASDAAQERLRLARSAERSLVHVTLFEPESKQTFNWRNWHAHAVMKAKTAFLTAFRKMVTGLYYLLWFAPFWIPGVVVAFLGSRFVYRRTRQCIRRWRDTGEGTAGPGLH